MENVDEVLKDYPSAASSIQTSSTPATPSDVPMVGSEISEAVGPSPPAWMSELRSKKPEDIMDSLNRVPLFMKTLDNTDGNGGENVELEALKALAYEGNPVEIATNFKEVSASCPALLVEWTSSFCSASMRSLGMGKRCFFGCLNSSFVHLFFGSFLFTTHHCVQIDDEHFLFPCFSNGC